MSPGIHMARTTPQLVATVIDTDGAIDLAPYIADATALVDAVCIPAGLSEATAAIVEKYLAAHFFAVFSPRISSTQAKGVGVTFQQKVDLNLFLTGQGQQACIFDTTGALAAWNQDVAKGRPRVKLGLWHIGGVNGVPASEAL